MSARRGLRFVPALTLLALVGPVAAGLIGTLGPEYPMVNWVLFSLGYLVIMGLGVHPLVIVLVGVQVVPATALGLTDLAYAVLILGLWTSSTIGSPMSANNLMFSKVLQVPVWRLAWLWNGPVVLVNWGLTVVIGLVVQANL